MNFFVNWHSKNGRDLASTDDFRRVFEDDLDGLYRLAFLLAGDSEKAEQCFVNGVENVVKGNSVFRDWAHSWAKRTIILGAIRIVRPRPVRVSSATASNRIAEKHGTPTMANIAIQSVLELEDFDRFVFVMTVLERYSENDCALLLECLPIEIRNARLRAVQAVCANQEARQMSQTVQGEAGDSVCS